METVNNQRYLIAVSGGPDSMALLDMEYKKGNYIEVAHVNYHKRDTALRDEKIVKDYCKNHNIKFNRLNFNPKDVKGNFQAAARLSRYEYFNKICQLHKLDAVLVAHHKDDHIETYLMQINKGLGVDYYGLRKETTLYGVKVIRPLLDYTKNDLLNYCIDNNLEYGIDESNLSDAYTRNKIRHSVIDNLSLKQKDEIVKEIDLKNNEQINNINEALKYLNDTNSYDIDYFINIPHIKLILRHYIPNKSEKYYDEMLRQFKDSKNCIFNNKSLYIVKEYGKINIFNKDEDYSYTFNNIDEIKSKKYKYFMIRKKGNSRQGATIYESDFPITIRNVNKDDYINMIYGTKKLNRFFIDNKINLKDRLNWPVVVNNKKELILVPELGCDINHYSTKHNIYVLKLY